VTDANFIHFNGTGSAFNPGLENTSAYFMRGSDFVLIDCGETVFSRVWNLLRSTQIKRIIVLITHLHCDHAGSLGTLISYCYYVLHKPVQLLHPAGTLKRYLEIVGIGDRLYTSYRSVPEDWNFTVVPYRVEHAPDMACFGYEVGFDDTSFYYSGDAHDIPAEVLSRFTERKIGLLFHDTSLDGHAQFHCPLSTLERDIPFPERKRVFCMHLDDSSNIPVLREKGFQVASADAREPADTAL